MINPGRLILKAWSELLDGKISKPVYRTDAPSNETGDYVLIRLEGSSTSNTNTSFVQNPVIIIDIVTRFTNKIDDTVIFDISSEIDNLLFTNPYQHNLPGQTGIQIVNVTKQNETVLPEDDGSTAKINRLVCRYLHKVALQAA